jgi:hypothetical protein
MKFWVYVCSRNFLEAAVGMTVVGLAWRKRMQIGLDMQVGSCELGLTSAMEGSPVI